MAPAQRKGGEASAEIDARQHHCSSTHSLICLTAPNFPKMSYISSDVILYGKFLWAKGAFMMHQGRRTREHASPKRT